MMRLTRWIREGVRLGQTGAGMCRFVAGSFFLLAFLLTGEHRLQADESAAAISSAPPAFVFKPTSMRFRLRQEFAPPSKGSQVIKSEGDVDIHLEMASPQGVHLLACRGIQISEAVTREGQKLKSRRSSSRLYEYEWGKPSANPRTEIPSGWMSFTMPEKFVDSRVDLTCQAEMVYASGLPEVMVIEPFEDLLGKRLTQPSIPGLTMILSRGKVTRDKEEEIILQATANQMHHFWGITFHDAMERQLQHKMQTIHAPGRNEVLARCHILVEGGPIASVRLEMFSNVHIQQIEFVLHDLAIFPRQDIQKEAETESTRPSSAGEFGKTRVLLRSVPQQPAPAPEQESQDKSRPQLEVNVENNE